MLDQSEYIRLERDPHQLGRELELLDPESWVVIDEVQKVPTLLDEVHRLIEKRGLRFVLCGSSTRKLKRSGVNLLAGRAELVRTTVQNYFEILVDTLLGYWLQQAGGASQVLSFRQRGGAGVVGESGLCANAGGVWATFGDISGQ